MATSTLEQSFREEEMPGERKQEYNKEIKRVRRNCLIGIAAGAILSIGNAAYWAGQISKTPERYEKAKQTLDMLEKEKKINIVGLPYSPNEAFSKRWDNYFGDSKAKNETLDLLINDIKQEIPIIESDPSYLKHRKTASNNYKYGFFGSIGISLVAGVGSIVGKRKAENRIKRRFGVID